MTRLDESIIAWWDWVTALSWQLAVLVPLVIAATILLRSAPPRVRHSLWLLVLVKVFLPTTISAPWSVGNWWPGPVAPLTASEGVSNAVPSAELWRGQSPIEGAGLIDLPVEHGQPASFRIPHSVIKNVFFVWLTGVCATAAVVVLRTRRLWRKLVLMPAIDEGPVRVAAEQAALMLRLNHSGDIRVSDEDVSPFLIGTIRPCIVVPRSLISGTTPAQLRTVLMHELLHFKHRDTWIGWLQVVVQCLLWFHPLVWLANSRLRHEREMVCDDAVLRAGGVSPDEYGETILRVLTAARGRSLVTGGLVGVFERGGQIQNRLESVMQFRNHNRRSLWGYGTLIAAFAILFLPMAPLETPSDAIAFSQEADSGETLSTAATQATEQSTAQEGKSENKTPYPVIVELQPAAGTTGVSPDLKELRVTFDRDMADAMSWTGGGAEFPSVDKSRKPHWINKRTCVLPVTLERAKYYRVGINSKSHQNFKDVTGKPVPPSAIFFTTEGASEALENRVRIPKVVEFSPENGDTDVPSKTTEIHVTFNMPMGDGMSWTGGGDNLPKTRAGGKPKWSKDRRTCTLPVSLQPNHEYRMGLNSVSHNNFQSKWGVPLDPVVYSFQTTD